MSHIVTTLTLELCQTNWYRIYFQTPVVVDQLWSDDEEVTSVGPGENIKAKLKGVEEEDVSPGFVLCDPDSPVRTGRVFDAQVNY